MIGVIDDNPISELLEKMRLALPSGTRVFEREKANKVSIRGKKIIVPKGFLSNKSQAFKMLAWAYAFCSDKTERPVVHWLFWWWPSYLSLLSFASVLSIWFGPLFFSFLVFLFFLLGRKKGRAHLLGRAYAAVLAVNFWKHGSIKDGTREWAINAITGFFLWGRRDAEKCIDGYIELIAATDKIRSDNILEYSTAYVDIYEVLTGVDFNDQEE